MNRVVPVACIVIYKKQNKKKQRNKQIQNKQKTKQNKTKKFFKPHEVSQFSPVCKGVHIRFPDFYCVFPTQRILFNTDNFTMSVAGADPGFQVRGGGGGGGRT